MVLIDAIQVLLTGSEKRGPARDQIRHKATALSGKPPSLSVSGHAANRPSWEMPAGAAGARYTGPVRTGQIVCQNPGKPMLALALSPRMA